METVEKTPRKLVREMFSYQKAIERAPDGCLRGVPIPANLQGWKEAVERLRSEIKQIAEQE